MISELIFSDCFLDLWQKSDVEAKKFNVSMHIKISVRYITRRTFNHLNRAIDIFNSFENILRAGPNPQQRQRNS